MAKPNYSFQKRQRDLEKKKKKEEKMEEKKQRKAANKDGGDTVADDAPATDALPSDQA